MQTKSAQEMQNEINLIRLAYRNRTEPLNRPRRRAAHGWPALLFILITTALLYIFLP